MNSPVLLHNNIINNSLSEVKSQNDDYEKISLTTSPTLDQ